MSRQQTTGSRDGEAKPMQLHAYDSVTQWAWGAAVSMSAALGRSLDGKPRARLLLSGGSTPAPVYSALAKAPLDWQRIDVALVDERWLQPDDPDSNAHLVRETLLRHRAAEARFETLTQPGRSIAEAVAAANMHASNPADVVVLGMGEDGHTASLFPNMIELEHALSTTAPYVSVDATGCPGAGAWLRRISLTPAGLQPAHTRIMLIRGGKKRELLDRVAAGDDPTEYPARIALLTPGAPLQVHWCP